MKNNQKGFVVPVLIAIISLLVIGGGIYIYQNKKVEAPAVVDTGTQQSNLQSDISNWKTYRNDKYRFEFKLPSDWQVKLTQNNNSGVFYLNSLENFKKIEEFKKIIQSERIQGTDAGPQNNLSISYYDDIKNSISVSESKKFSSGSLEEYIKINSDFVNSQKITFAGEVAFKGKLLGLYDPVTILVKNNDHFYSIGLESVNGMDAQLSDKILSTFKFTTPSTTVTNEQKVVNTAREVLGVLATRDYQKLEGLVSSDGLSLNQEPRFDFVKNLIAKNDVSIIPKDTKIYLWGYTDGKGDPINLTRAQFLTTYIYTGSVDYLKAPDVAVNKKLGGGNSINTIDKDINGRTYVAFHFSGFDPKYGGMDWTTLYLVFDSVNGEYKLRGIAKDNWTI